MSESSHARSGQSGHTRLNVLFVGSVVPPDRQHELKASSAAGNKYQFGLATSLASDVVRVSVIGFEPHAMWRHRGDRLIIAQQQGSLAPNVPYKNVSFLNALGIKQITIAIATLRKVYLDLSHESAIPRSTVLIYNPLSYQFLPALIATRLRKVPVGLLLADVPLRAERRGILGAFDHAIQMAGLRWADYLVTLTESAQKDLGRGRPGFVLEGAADSQALGNRPARRSSRPPRRILYAGSLNSLSGLPLAIDAVRLLPPGAVQLDIYGSGTEAEIAAVQDASDGELIRYCGRRPHHEILLAERDADVLLLPRIPDTFATRYTFPSKVFEYMASGVPIVANRLACFSDEYTPFINFAAEPTPASWAETIAAVLNERSDESWGRAERAARFVKTMKNWPAQARALNEFLEEVVIDD